LGYHGGEMFVLFCVKRRPLYPGTSYPSSNLEGGLKCPRVSFDWMMKKDIIAPV